MAKASATFEDPARLVRAIAKQLPTEEGMILLIGLYRDAEPGRWAELLECLERNLRADRLEEIHVLIEDGTDPRDILEFRPTLKSDKIKWIAHGRRLSYRDFFEYANRDLIDRDVIIANADIFFDHSLARLDGYDLAGKLLCLSRWDVQPDGSANFFDHPDSQDAWIFRAPIRSFYCDFQLGLPGCDNRLAWEAEAAGLSISNPSRSIRANHLHLSGVRRYHQGQRILGWTRSAPADFLGGEWLWFVVPCKGRLEDLRRTMPPLLEQPRSSYVLVDYSCPDSAGAWVQERFPRASVVEVRDRARFNGAEARNKGAAVVDGDGIVCFIDADMRASDGFSEHILSSFEKGSYLVPDRNGPGYDSTVVCTKSDFESVGGFDERFLDWGEECVDLRMALSGLGLSEWTFPSTLLSHLGGHERTDHFRMIKDPQTNRSIHSAYRTIKAAIFDEAGPDGISPAGLDHLYSAITSRRLCRTGQAAEARSAAVAFSERMGYTIARLESGACSHNNDPRVISEIPERLVGLQFTQVVAFSVSPIEIEFLTSGKLYVLVGDDWEGSAVAESWLSRAALKEDMPSVRTASGGGFAVWSLEGEVGERYVLPTQVMLAAARLVRIEETASRLATAARQNGA